MTRANFGITSSPGEGRAKIAAISLVKTKIKPQANMDEASQFEPLAHDSDNFQSAQFPWKEWTAIGGLIAGSILNAAAILLGWYHLHLN